MSAHYGWSGGITGVRGGALAVLALVVLAACEDAPASRPASLLSTPLPVEPDTTTFEPMELGPPPVTADVSLADDAEPEEDEDDGSHHAYPAWNGYDLDCADVGHTVKVTGDDPHRLDRDGDGWGCESY